MSEGTIYDVFLGKNVDVGIPNFRDPSRLFIINGFVIEVKDGYVTLRIKGGFRKISFGDIISIQIKEPGEIKTARRDSP